MTGAAHSVMRTLVDPCLNGPGRTKQRTVNVETEEFTCMFWGRHAEQVQDGKSIKTRHVDLQNGKDGQD